MKKDHFKTLFTGDIGSNKLFAVAVYTILGIVGLVMTILNIVTQKGLLTWCTGIFAVCCFINVFLAFFNPVTAAVARVFFSVEILLMFSFFLISGNPDGFSAIWICMLPSVGMLFFNRSRGSVLCAVMFVIMVFLLWFPAGQALLQYDYNETFRMCFPILFIAFHALAFVLETLRSNAYKEIVRLQDHYKELSVRDQLTGMFNRQGMYSMLETEKKYSNAKSLGVAIFDIDFFKAVNDRYGHHAGDMVLKEVSRLLKENLGSLVCRWGGEEFVVVYAEDELLPAGFDQIRNLIAMHRFESNDIEFGVTISIGLYIKENADPKRIDELINKADEALYYAKETGRNRLVQFDELAELPEKETSPLS